MPEHLDTSTQRPPTGMNRGAREMILNIVSGQHYRYYVTATNVIDAFFNKRYSSREDYYEALEEVWGAGVRTNCARAVDEAESQVEGEVSARNLLRRFLGSGRVGLALGPFS